MKKIMYRDFENGSIDFLRNMCNSLMEFQAKNAKIRPDIMASMNFENRLRPDYINTERKYMAVAYDGDKPVGFAFASVSEVTKGSLSAKPSWANDLEGLGFYPDNYEVPKNIGTYKLLFVDPNYRGLNIGGQLSNMIMSWLNNQDDIEDLWVFVANGNEKVGKFYEKFGFKLSHNVFNGFIQAYCQKNK